MAAGEAGAAGHHFSKAVGVTHDMAFQFIKVTSNVLLLRVPTRYLVSTARLELDLSRTIQKKKHDDSDPASA